MATEGILDALPVHPAPAVDLQTHGVRIDGLVPRPLSLSLLDLRALEQQEFVDDFGCLEGWTVPGLRWRGVALPTLLALAEPLVDARWAQVSSGDFSLPLPLAEASRALLALELNGAPLPAEHGAPARLVLDGGECFTSVKWVDRIELRSQPAPNSARETALQRLPTRDRV